MAATYRIGQLAALSGLPIKTIRFYSDAGLLPPTRTAAGHRRYDPTDLARLQLIRSLRDLDVDLPTIRRVLHGHDRLSDVLAAHIQTLEARMRTLRRQLAVLRVAARSPTDDTVRRIQTLARLDAAERRQLLERFWARALAGTPAALAERFRAGGSPELPEDATAEQLDAWLELAELTQDEDFTRRTQASGAWFWAHARPGLDPTAWQAESRAVLEAAARAHDAGLPPADPRADRLVDQFVGGYARAFRRRVSPALRRWLVEQIEAHTDPRAARYWELVASVAGTAPDPGMLRLGRAHAWLVDAVRARLGHPLHLQ